TELSIPVAGSESVLIMKAKTKIVPEIVSGNGTLRYNYSVTKDGEATTYYEETALTEVATSVPIIFDLMRCLSAPQSGTGTEIVDGEKQIFSFKIWDETEGTTQGSDSLSATLKILMDVAVRDTVKPTITVMPYHWTNEHDNSLYQNSRKNGHIELEGDLPTANFNGTGVLDASDPKVSGKISFSGSAHDNKMLKELYVTIKGFKGGASFKLASYDKASKTWAAESTDLATLTISQSGHIIAGVPAPDEKEKFSAPEGMVGRHWEGRDWQAPISDLYLPGRHFRIAKDAPAAEWAQIKDSLRNYNTVIVSVLGTSDLASRRYGISDATSRFFGSFDFDGRLVLNVAGLPYCLNRFPDLNRPDAILLSYSDESLFQEMAMQGIFGGIAISGQTPVPFELHLPPDSSARSGPAMLEVPAGTGLYTAAGRLSYGLPEDVGLNADTLRKLEAIVDEAINMKAIPGCQVLVARYGKVVWHRAYGYHTYLNRRPVALDDIYDLASVTKVSATLPSLMRLRDLGLFHEDSLLATYGVVPDSSNKAGLLCEDILTHRSGLVAWIPFYYHTLEPLDSSQLLFSKAYSESNPLKISQGAWANKNVVYKEGIYQDHFSQEYPLHVADHLYMNTGYRDSIWDGIANSELVETKYRYSDLGLMLMQRVVEAVSDTLLYPYVWRNFYAPLGATTTGYVPLERFERSRIVPTENDMFFRHQLLQGHVHDPGAAMLGGVAGHAGLFSSANDLAKLWQMFLNGGSYGGRRYIEQATMDRYNTCLHCDEENRRGIGFDKPIYWEENAGTACDEASPSSFGHSGFTGTLVWVDPKTELLYVFLSNRVHPNQSNILLIENDIRTRIQSLLYRAIEK
ncbi:MAG: hypothetical protein CSA96_03485, partial [Bacteroidetes bacterium]